MDSVPVAGATKDWKEVLALYYPRVRGWFAHVVTDQAEVDDLSQEVFVRLYDRVVEGEIVVNAWNYTKAIARNVFLEYLRAQRNRRGRYPLDEEPAISADSGPAENCSQAELVAVIPELLGELTAAERTLLVGRYFLGMSMRELAEATGASASTVVERHNRALCTLRRLALDRGIEPEGACHDPQRTR